MVKDRGRRTNNGWPIKVSKDLTWLLTADCVQPNSSDAAVKLRCLAAASNDRKNDKCGSCFMDKFYLNCSVGPAVLKSFDYSVRYMNMWD